MINKGLNPNSAGRWIFVGERVNVVCAGEIPEPTSFVWRARKYQISEILLSWFDWNFSAGAKIRNWKSRRHRKYFRVSTACGELFEIYLDRKGRNTAGEWVCSQQWEAANSQP